MKRILISPEPLEGEDLGIRSVWSEWKPCREMQPTGFPVPDLCGDPSKVQVVVTHDVAQLAVEVAEMRAQLSKQMSDIQRKLSGLKKRVLHPRSREQVSQEANQGTLPFLPPELSSISDAIERSRAVVNRPQDPSDELGLTCSQETWRRAIRTLTAHALSVWQKARVVIRSPVISAGPDGSVDLYWTAAPYGLLLNVPANPKQPATYYGDDAANPDCNRTSGKLESTKQVDPGVLMWLAYTAEQ
ncbi:MAG: hypothetical protein HY735_11655 [Verrucomicrobia bacterium]|nr:hypothetical protein [Verrucomicrobiota bacterium]